MFLRRLLDGRSREGVGGTEGVFDRIVGTVVITEGEFARVLIARFAIARIEADAILRGEGDGLDASPGTAQIVEEVIRMSPRLGRAG